MFKSLKNKLFGGSNQVVNEIEVETKVEEPIEVANTGDSVNKMTSNDLQEQSVNLEEIVEADFLDLNATKEVQAKYEEVLTKLDNVVSLVEENTSELSTMESLQHESNLLAYEAEIESLQAKATADLNRIVKESKEMLLAESDEIKKNSDTFLINEGMFDLNSQLHNAKLIIEDTEIPQAISKQDVLDK